MNFAIAELSVKNLQCDNATCRLHCPPPPSPGTEKGFFQHPPFPFFSEIFHSAVVVYLCLLHLWSEWGPGERGYPRCRSLGNGLRLDLCLLITVESLMRDRAVLGSSFQPDALPSRISCAKHLVGREETGNKVPQENR